MALISALISELRVDLADEASTRWSDATLLLVFKKAIRRANRILQRNGIQFAKKHSHFHTTAASDNVTLSTAISDFDVMICMTRNDNNTPVVLIDEREWDSIVDTDALAYAFIDYAADKIYFKDTDSSAIQVDVHYYPTVAAPTAVLDSTPWAGRIDDILMEYVGIRMKNVDEMDVQFDQSLMQDMENQILLAYRPNSCTFAEGKGWL
jgi:hypothetical protein